MEAIASEVALLRRHFPASVAWGLSRRHWAVFSWHRGYCLHPRLHLLFRGATRLLEPAFQLNHIFGSLGDWFYLSAQRWRPTVLTMAAFDKPVQPPLLERIQGYVVEYPRGVDYLKTLGVESSRIRLILPAVDLEQFAPDGPPDAPFTVLFASSPDEEDWLQARGVPQLLEAAGLRPQMQFRLLWRPWGNSLARVQEWIAQRELTNVELRVGRFADMEVQYRAAHVTVTPFVDIAQCKPAPNSLIESLACGRPVVTTPEVGLAELVGEAKAGLVSPANGPALAECFDRIQVDWCTFSENARRLAERQFAAQRFVEGYQRLYAEVIAAVDCPR